jgi:mannose/fructose/N-acetylgalactosamine-specific phosphotransferase system component IID
MAIFSNIARFPIGEILGASALTGLCCLWVAHAETTAPEPRQSETFVECTTLLDKCMPGTSSVIKNIVCTMLEKHFTIRKDSISCK